MSDDLGKIVITGISGFVGQNLRVYLKQKYSVIGISRTPHKNYEQSYEDLDLKFFNENKVFIHLAGKAHDLKKCSNEKEYFEINTELTKKLFDQFIKSDCETFIYMSSVKAAADTVEDVLMESIVPNPITAYGRSKLAAENYIRKQTLPNNKRVYILRPCMIHGPNNKGNLNLLYNFVSKSIPYPFGRYSNERSFVSIENLCFVINELIKNKNIPSGVYNLADDETLSTKELVILIGEVINKPAKVLDISKILVKVLAKLGDIFPLPVNTERLEKLTENYVVSNDKIKKSMNKELPLTAKEGLRKTIASFSNI